MVHKGTPPNYAADPAAFARRKSGIECRLIRSTSASSSLALSLAMGTPLPRAKARQRIAADWPEDAAAGDATTVLRGTPPNHAADPAAARLAQSEVPGTV